MTVQERADELKRRIEQEHGPGQFLFVAVFCNGCGANISAANPAKLALLLNGWRLGSFGGDDYCPRCLG